MHLSFVKIKNIIQYQRLVFSSLFHVEIEFSCLLKVYLEKLHPPQCDAVYCFCFCRGLTTTSTQCRLYCSRDSLDNCMCCHTCEIKRYLSFLTPGHSIQTPGLTCKLGIQRDAQFSHTVTTLRLVQQRKNPAVARVRSWDILHERPMRYPLGHHAPRCFLYKAQKFKTVQKY